ncbi:MAG: bifunctional DNA-formamidopyrimidine glycosylase/DNA-(apurinic or apyrimidinic site) lyase [Candidatus Liptonbacteria bacterium]|nr:bifunctional DNA-formamidopyrimidine glycosylase/DNA-(apurinic or apyrimidinic site) lyase [Candidatus Liptonbacteria bacterium]
MPELPEVETIIRELRAKISGKELRELFIFDKRIGRLRVSLPLKITGVDRHGKFIVIHSSRGKILLHLRMSGRLQFSEKGKSKRSHKSERAIFVFGDGSVLKFFDPRRFGTIEWRKGKLPELGLNPLGPEFTYKNFRDILHSRSRTIKNLLLDQKIVAGLGNIYVDESLWFAKINPRRKSDSFSDMEIKRLRTAIVQVLKEAIRRGGFTLRDYKKTTGKKGSYQLFRKAYSREGLPCSRCRSRIKRIKIGGRGTYFCPKCQA